MMTFTDSRGINSTIKAVVTANRNVMVLNVSGVLPFTLMYNAQCPVLPQYFVAL